MLVIYYAAGTEANPLAATGGDIASAIIPIVAGLGGAKLAERGALKALTKRKLIADVTTAEATAARTPTLAQRGEVALERGKAALGREPLVTSKLESGAGQAAANLAQAPNEAELLATKLEQAQADLANAPLTQEAKQLGNEISRLRARLLAGEVNPQTATAMLQRLAKIKRGIP